MNSIGICAVALLCAAAPCAAAEGLHKSVGPNGVLEFTDVAPDAGPSREEPSPETDPAVARANARLDLAEHAFAQTLRAVSSHSDSMRMVSMRASRADKERLAFYRKDVLLARRQLFEVLNAKRKAAAVPPTLTVSNEEWVPVSLASRR